MIGTQRLVSQTAVRDRGASPFRIARRAVMGVPSVFHFSAHRRRFGVAFAPAGSRRFLRPLELLWPLPLGFC